MNEEDFASKLRQVEITDTGHIFKLPNGYFKFFNSEKTITNDIGEFIGD